MSKKIILFDWDDTLFSKKIYKNNLIVNLARICGISEDEAKRVDEEYFDNLSKSGDFEIGNYLKYFEDKFGKEIETEDFKSDRLKIYSGALFPETIEVLEKLKDKFTLGIFSQGFESLQKIKIKYSGIEKFFDQNFIFISRDKTQADFIKKLPNGAIIMDDKKEVLEKLKEVERFEVIWVNRKTDEKIDGVRMIKNLYDLI